MKLPGLPFSPKRLGLIRLTLSQRPPSTAAVDDFALSGGKANGGISNR